MNVNSVSLKTGFITRFWPQIAQLSAKTAHLSDFCQLLQGNNIFTSG
jgi:hypothetical protein